MERPGHIQITLASGVARPGVPCHIDCLSGAGRPTGCLDHGAVDETLRRRGGGFRAACVFHARRSLGRVGQQSAAFDEMEEALALSRTYRVELADSSATRDVIRALRDLAMVESAAVQTLATAPATAVAAALPRAAPEARPFERVQATRALEREPGNERVTVAVVDTGVSLGHPELQRKLLAGFDTVDLGMGRVSPALRLVGDSWGQDFLPQDETGHGSHVAGIIGAQGWRMHRGMAGRSLLLPIRVLAAASGGVGAQGKMVGVGALPDIDAGIKVAVDLGADVINMSFGTPESGIDADGHTPHGAVVRYAAQHGCVLVAAAGNSGVPERFFPASLPEVIAVGSVDEQGQRSVFSTYGEHLALSAPGEEIFSIDRQQYKHSTGTSHAAPFVAGAAALLVSRARRDGRELDGRDARRLLIESAAPLGEGGFSNEVGHGLLDADAALRRLEEELSGDNPPGRSK